VRLRETWTFVVNVHREMAGSLGRSISDGGGEGKAIQKRPGCTGWRRAGIGTESAGSKGPSSQSRGLIHNF
jgi:hypothetical protein